MDELPELNNRRVFMSQFPSEGAVLEGGEEGVQLRQRRALRRLQRLHRRDSAGEFALQWMEGTGNDRESLKLN